jgi:uncharacterized protein (TIGR00369 family)
LLPAFDLGRTRFAYRPGAVVDNGQGVTHGGILAAVADFAVTTAVMTHLPADRLVRTTNLAVSYIRPVPPGAEAVCEGRVVHLGRTLAHADATMTDADGRLLLRATATCHLQHPVDGPLRDASTPPALLP